MAVKKPLANYAGKVKELQSGDSVSGATLASTTEVLTGTDTAKAVTADALAALWEAGSDIASAGTISVGEGGQFNITGTTTITDIDLGTDKAGRTVWFKFAGAVTLTHNGSTLILPTAANITTAAGDIAAFRSEGSDVVRCISYQRASGLPLVGMRTLFYSTTDVTTAGTTEETFYTITIAAATLVTDGDRIKTNFTGLSENNANSKKWLVNVAGSTCLTTTQTVNLRTGWDIQVRIKRKSNTELNVIASLIAAGSGADATYVKKTALTGLNLTTTAYDIVLKVTTATALGDVTADGYEVEYFPFTG